MTEEFVSEVKQIPHNDERIFTMLSDLSNLERIKDRIPQDKIKNFEFDSDTCSFAVDPVGKITFQIVEREPNKLIKFTTTNSPVPLFLWIQLKQVAEDDTRLKITVRADLNPFLFHHARQNRLLFLCHRAVAHRLIKRGKCLKRRHRPFFLRFFLQSFPRPLIVHPDLQNMRK